MYRSVVNDINDAPIPGARITCAPTSAMKWSIWW